MRSSLISKFRPLLPYLLILPAAFLVSQLVVDPGPKIRMLFLLCGALVFFFLLPKRYLLFPVLFLAYFPRPLRIPGIYHSTNGLFLLLFLALFLRMVVEKESIISFRRIVKNPFFLPSLLIWLSYLVAWLIASFSLSNGMEMHTTYLCSISSALVMTNIIIGFVQDKFTFRYMQLLFLLLLVLNLFFGIVFFLRPGLVLVPGIIEDRSAFASGALRLGGLTFTWEAFAEYLMMSVVILFGLISNRIYKDNKIVHNGLILLLLLAIIELMLTNTRGALALTVAGIALILLFFTKLAIHKKIVFIAGAALLIGAALFIVFQSGQVALLERMESFNELTRTEYGYMPADRVSTWVPALKHVIQHGLTGSGPSFVPLTNWDGGRGYLTHWPHNLILLILSTVGLFGLIGYGFLITRIFLLKRIITKIGNQEQRLFYLMLWLATLLFFFETLKFDGFLRMPNNYFYHIWILLGFLFSAANLTDPQAQNYASSTHYSR